MTGYTLHIYVLSPHRDDAAFSLSLSLGRWLADGHRLTVVNAFTRTDYAPYAKAVDVGEVSAIRRREDDAFIRSFDGLEMIDLDLDDAPLRLGYDSNRVCEMSVSEHDAAIPAIYNALETRMTSDAALLLPLALGRHVDHRTARDAAIGMLPRVPCAFYEDLPYAMRDGAASDLAELRRDLQARWGQRLYPELSRGARLRPADSKMALVMSYGSQIDAPQARAIADFSNRYGGAERLWVNEAWRVVSAHERLSVQQQDESWEPLQA